MVEPRAGQGRAEVECERVNSQVKQSKTLGNNTTLGSLLSLVSTHCTPTLFTHSAGGTMGNTAPSLFT